MAWKNVHPAVANCTGRLVKCSHGGWYIALTIGTNSPVFPSEGQAIVWFSDLRAGKFS